MEALFQGNYKLELTKLIDDRKRLIIQIISGHVRVYAKNVKTIILKLS